MTATIAEFSRLLAALSLKQSLAFIAAMLIAAAAAVASVSTHSMTSITLRKCAQPLTHESVSNAGVGLGAGQGWLVGVEPDGPAWALRYRNPEVGLYPDALARSLGCGWDRQVRIDTPALAVGLAPFTLASFSLSALAVALAHRRTRQLIRETDLKNGWRIPVPALLGLLALVGVQVAVGVSYPDFIRSISERQLALLSSPGVLVALVLAPLAEELWFRATALRMFEQRGFRHSGLLVTSIAFGALHGTAGGEWPAVLYYWGMLSIAGALFGWVWLKTGNWLSCALLHYLNNLPAMIVVLAWSLGASAPA